MLSSRVPRLLPRWLPQRYTEARCQHRSTQASPVPAPSHNVPSYTPLLTVVDQRREEASRSVLVQVAGFPSAPDLSSYCQQTFGPVRGLHYHTNSVGQFKAFFIVEFEAVESVAAVLRLAQHSTTDGGGQPVPVYSPFLWLQGSPGGGSLEQAASMEVFPQAEEPREVMERARLQEDVSHQMFLIWKASLMSETSTRLRYLLGRQLELAISGLFPRAQVMPFGSSVNGFGTSTSDQDMFLMLDSPRPVQDPSRLVFHAKGGVVGGERAQVQRHCEEVAKIIQSFLPGCQDVQTILNARVPIIKYSHQFAGLECDLQMSSSSGLQMSALLHLWAGLDWRVRPLVATVRHWAKAQGLVKNVRPTHFFTNFTLTLLVVCYLQQQHGMLPSLAKLGAMAGQGDTVACEGGIQVNFLHDVSGLKPELNACYSSPDSLAELLAGFFHFFAQFDFETRCLCPVAGETRAKDTRWRNSSAMDVVNPLETDLNLSYNLNKHAVKRFQVKAGEAAATLEQEVGGVFDILGVKDQRRQTVVPRQTKLRDMDLFSETAELKELKLSKSKTPEPEVEKRSPTARRARTPSPGPSARTPTSRASSARKPIVLMNDLFQDTTSLQDELPKRTKNKSQPQGVDVLKSMVSLSRETVVKTEVVGAVTDAVKKASSDPEQESSKNNLRSDEKVKKVKKVNEIKVAAKLSSEQLRIEDLKMKYLRGSVNQSDTKL